MILFEPETIEFMNALEIDRDSSIYFPGTSQEIDGYSQWLAINNFGVYAKDLLGLPKGVLNLRARLIGGVWPMMGGTSGRMIYNYLNPLNTNAAFRLTLNGGLTILNTGFKGNASNAWLNTNLQPSVVFAGGGGYHSQAIYRKNYTVGVPMGTGTNAAGVYFDRSANNLAAGGGGGGVTIVGALNGCFQIWRNNATSFNYRKNGVTTNHLSNFQGPGTHMTSILCHAATSPVFFSDAEARYAHDVVSLTNQEAADFETIITNLQQALFRA